MNKDMSVSSFSPEFSFDNKNIRLSTNEGNTMMSWVNERGTKYLELDITNTIGSSVGSKETSLRGTVIGTAIINHKLVIFSVYESDTLKKENGYFTSDNIAEKNLVILGNCYIYTFDTPEGNTIKGELIYQGYLDFDTKHPLETLVSYESETVQKVYWTDNKNQPRFINIKSNKNSRVHHASYVDFVPEISFNANITVENIYGSGEFPAGVIQYAFTYYNKNGQESCIFYTTPLHYISYVNRGAKPGDKVGMSFKICINGYSEYDFDYIRIYSILRTSKDSVPLVKHVQDVNAIAGTTFIDNGLLGETIDPTELLYKGGEYIVAKTLSQKDGTLFLGNLKTNNLDVKPYASSIKSWLKNTVNYYNEDGTSKFDKVPATFSKVEAILDNRKIKTTTEEPILYINTLTSEDGVTGFKSREYYRLGIQFQYKTGRWSEPIWIGDFSDSKKVNSAETILPSIEKATNEGYYNVKLPGFQFTLGNGIYKKVWNKDKNKYEDILYDTLFKELYEEGYRTVRPLFAVPNITDRTILLQGIMCPTMYRPSKRYSDSLTQEQGTLYAQSSWLFRTYTSNKGKAKNNGGYVYGGDGKLPSQYDTSFEDTIISPYLRNTEVMGVFDDDNAFAVSYNMMTIHSPEITFDTFCNSLDFTGYELQNVGKLEFEKTYGDIDIQTSTPAINSTSAGFIHKSIVTEGNAALISGLFYNDFLVDDVDNGDKYRYWIDEKFPIYFPVYMWHRKASLNNDVERANRSAQILKKKISNYRVGKFPEYSKDFTTYDVDDMDLFSSDELTIIKLDGKVYMGNIEDGVLPTENSPIYICGNPYESDKTKFDEDANFGGNVKYRLCLNDPKNSDSKNGLEELKLKAGGYSWERINSAVGNYTKGLCQNRDIVNIKYKSTPHIVVYSEKGFYDSKFKDALRMVEIVKPYKEDTFMGGNTDNVLQSHTWIPCGPVENINKDTTQLTLKYKWGDTYFQQYECLKTYPFTNEDINQVIEIASFVCETRVNIDGRYDRNRGMTSNLNVSPTNFNLFNTVYSQMDNFFNYKILDESNYKNTSSPNLVTWTKTKESGADVDLWTNITLATTLELDGDKGSINKLLRFNNLLLAFQDSGISQILYNENTQISTTEGVPIEIANSQKVQGKRYLSDTVGCSNKKSIVQTPLGIYFIDSNNKDIYRFSDQLSNLSTAGSFNSWSKQNISLVKEEWNPIDFNDFVSCYDALNQEILFINKNTALAYSEKFNCFTSFYDYNNAPFFENFDGVGIWVKDNKIWQHQSGEYCNFFGTNKSFSMTLIANQEPQLDKIFTNLEFRACVADEGSYNAKEDKFTASLPFDSLEAWNEYQHGITTLNHRNKGENFHHGTMGSILNRKFRIWRCDIPRDNAEVNPTMEIPLGIKRFKVRPLDRIRNTWAYIKLSKNAATEKSYLQKTEIHDIMATYFA